MRIARLLASVTFASASAAADEPDTTHITVVTSVTATSTLAGKVKDYYAAANVLYFDRDEEHGMPPQQAWCEGKPDEGIGEGVTLAFAAPVTIPEIVVRGGYWKTDKLFRANNIV